MPKLYTPLDWYWLASDGRVYSSARQTIVKQDDADFAAWKDDGTEPQRWPQDEAGKESDAELAAVVGAFGLSVPGVVTVPQTVGRAQAKIALLRAGLLDKVKEAVAKDPELQIWFDDATVWERQNPHVVALGEALLGGDPKKIDDLFVAAGQVAA